MRAWFKDPMVRNDRIEPLKGTTAFAGMKPTQVSDEIGSHREEQLFEIAGAGGEWLGLQKRPRARLASFTFDKISAKHKGMSIRVGRHRASEMMQR